MKWKRWLTLYLILSMQLQAFAGESWQCQALFVANLGVADHGDVRQTMASTRTSKLSSEDGVVFYRNLRLTKIADIFKEEVEAQRADGQYQTAYKITPQIENAFKAKFDLLLTYMSHYDGFNTKDFRKWLANRSQRLDGLQMKTIFGSATLEQYVHELHFQYLLESKKSPITDSSWVRGMAKVASASKKITAFIVTQFLIFGFVMPLAQTIPKPITDPVIQVTDQVSRKTLDTAVQIEMQMLSKLVANGPAVSAEAQELRALNDTLRRFNFENLSTQQALDVWAGLEKQYSVIFARKNKTLSGNQQSGRDYIRWLVYDVPTWYAAMESTFRTHYLAAESSLIALQEKIKLRNKATPDELAKIEILKSDLVDAEARLAGAIASFKMIMLMYSEGARNVNLSAEERAKLSEVDKLLGDSMVRYAQYLRMGIFADQFTKQIEDILTRIDPTLPNIPQIAHPLKGP